YSAPEFIVVIMSEAPTLASANTIPGPMRRRRPAHDVGAEAAFFVCDVVSADIGGVGSFTWVRRRRRHRSHRRRSLRRVWPRASHVATRVSLPGKRLRFDPRRRSAQQALKAHSSRRVRRRFAVFERILDAMADALDEGPFFHGPRAELVPGDPRTA